MEKLKFALIGGGFITQFYKLGLEKSKNLKLVAIADINENCLAKSLYNVNFYTDYLEMIEKEKPDVIHICVGVSAHYKVVKNVLKHKISVLIEKPLCENMERVNELYEIAKENNVHLQVVYHFEFGEEALWLKNNIKKFGKVVRYSFFAHEQYAYNENHVVVEAKRGLGDSWLDAAINLISDINLVVDLKDVKKTREIVDIDPQTNIIRYSHKTFVTGEGVEFDIMSDWMTSDRTKISVIDTTKGRLIIDHHEQIIYFNGKVVYKKIPKIHRMHIQYKNFFKNFAWETNSETKTKLLHTILFM